MNKRNVDNIFVKSEIIFVIFLMALFSVETADAQIKKQQTLQHSIKVSSINSIYPLVSDSRTL
jgi:hypothetical protein